MIRTFSLQLPDVEAIAGRDSLTISAPRRLYIPRQLHEGGLAAYEPETLACHLACLERAPDGAFYDIGANVGVFSWLAAAVCDRRIVAFEPTPDTAAVCKKIASDNDLAIDLETVALADTEGTATLYLSVQSDCSNSLDASFRKATGEIQVEVTTVDAYRARTGIEPAILKIDTEQTEPAVIRGAMSLLREHRPWLLCEVLRGQEVELTELLEPLDYSWYQVTDDRPLIQRNEIFGDRSNTFRNWLFAPRDLDDAFSERTAYWYDLLIECKAQSVRRRIDAPAFSFGSAEQFQSRWRPTDQPRFKAHSSGDSVQVQSSLDADESLYFFHGQKGFEEPETAEASVPITSRRQYELALDVSENGTDMPRITLWVMQYSPTSKVESKRLHLKPGKNLVSFDTHADATTLRVAFRVAGSGTCELGSLSVHEVSAAGR